MTGVWDSQVSGPLVLETKHPRASSSYSKDSGPPPYHFPCPCPLQKEIPRSGPTAPGGSGQLQAWGATPFPGRLLPFY